MIICAALKVIIPSEEIIISGLRHGDCYYQMQKMHLKDYTVVEGFVDNDGEFYDRRLAFDKAYSSGQLSATVVGHKADNKENELYSEDLY